MKNKNDVFAEVFNPDFRQTLSILSWSETRLHNARVQGISNLGA